MEGASGYLGPALMGFLALIGFVGSWFTQKAKNAEHSTRIRELSSDREVAKARADSASNAVVALELRIEREFVRKMDLAEVEKRIGSRLDQVSQDLKGAITQIIPALASHRGRGTQRGAE